MYSNSCCTCPFESEIIKISQSSHQMYSNDVLNFQESTTILDVHRKNVWKFIVCTSYFQAIAGKINSVGQGKYPKPHHHHVTLSARIFLIFSRHPSLSSIASGRSSGLHPVSAQSCCMLVLAGRPAFAWPCERVHRSSSLISSSLLL